LLFRTSPRDLFSAIPLPHMTSASDCPKWHKP
jgi:hypothetical protein